MFCVCGFLTSASVIFMSERNVMMISSAGRPNPDDGGDGITSQELILEKLLRMARSASIGDYKTSRLPPYYGDFIQSGSLQDLFRRQTVGIPGPFVNPGRAPVWIDEHGGVHCDNWRLNLTPMFGSSMQDHINFLIWSNPNIGGGIDPPPPWIMPI